MPSPEQSVQVSPAPFTQAAYSANGILAVSTLNQIAIYTLQGELLQVVDIGKPKGAWQIAWADNETLYLADQQQLLIWELNQQRIGGGWSFSESSIAQLAAYQHQVAVSQDNGALSLLTVGTTGEVENRQQATAHRARIHRLLFTEQGKTLLSADRSGLLSNWSFSDNTLQWQYQVPPDYQIMAMAERPEAGLISIITTARGDLLIGEKEHRIIHLHLKDGKMKDTWTLHAASTIGSLSWTSFGLVVGGSHNEWQLVNENGSVLNRSWPRTRQFGRDTGRVQAFFTDDNRLYAVTTSGYLQIWSKRDIIAAINREN